jgi:FixJ family two-component response regulator
VARRSAFRSEPVPLSSSGDVPKTVQAMKAGAVEFLTKPLDDDVLLLGLPGDAFVCIEKDE